MFDTFKYSVFNKSFLNKNSFFGSNHTDVFSSNLSTLEKVISNLRNTVLLSLLLGLTWIMAAVPTSVTQQ